MWVRLLKLLEGFSIVWVPAGCDHPVHSVVFVSWADGVCGLLGARSSRTLRFRHDLQRQQQQLASQACRKARPFTSCPELACPTNSPHARCDHLSPAPLSTICLTYSKPRPLEAPTTNETRSVLWSACASLAKTDVWEQDVEANACLRQG